SSGIHVTEIDKARLEELIEIEQGPALVALEHEIERAVVVDPRDVAREIVTMNSRVALRLDDEPEQVSLVYPQDADQRLGRLSILPEVGAAIVRYQEGDTIDCMVLDRTRRIRIDRVIYQPESARDFHLLPQLRPGGRPSRKSLNS